MRMRWLVVLLALAAFQYRHELTGHVQRYLHPDAATVNSIEVFTFAGCGAPCATLLQDLRQRQLPVTETMLTGPGTPDFDRYRDHGGSNTFPSILVNNTELLPNMSNAATVSHLASIMGEGVLTEGERYFIRRHFHDATPQDANQHGATRPRVVLYGTDWCGVCTQTRAWLNANGIAFSDIDVEKDPEGRHMIRELAIGGYPTLYVGYQRGEGFNPQWLEKTIKQAGL